MNSHHVPPYYSSLQQLHQAITLLANIGDRFQTTEQINADRQFNNVFDGVLRYYQTAINQLKDVVQMDEFWQENTINTFLKRDEIARYLDEEKEYRLYTIAQPLTLDFLRCVNTCNRHFVERDSFFIRITRISLLLKSKKLNEAKTVIDELSGALSKAKQENMKATYITPLKFHLDSLNKMNKETAQHIHQQLLKIINSTSRIKEGEIKALLLLNIASTMEQLSHYYATAFNFTKAIDLHKQLVMLIEKAIKPILSQCSIKEQIRLNELTKIEFHQNRLATLPALKTAHQNTLVSLFESSIDNAIFNVDLSEGRIKLSFKNSNTLQLMLTALKESLFQVKNSKNQIELELDGISINHAKKLLEKFIQRFNDSLADLSRQIPQLASAASTSAPSKSADKKRRRRLKKQADKAKQTANNEVGTSGSSTYDDLTSTALILTGSSNNTTILLEDGSRDDVNNYQRINFSTHLTLFHFSENFFDTVPTEYHERIQRIANQASSLAPKTPGQGHIRNKDGKYKLKFLGKGIGNCRAMGRVEKVGTLEDKKTRVEIVVYDHFKTKAHIRS